MYSLLSLWYSFDSDDLEEKCVKQKYRVAFVLPVHEGYQDAPKQGEFIQFLAAIIFEDCDEERLIGKEIAKLVTWREHLAVFDVQRIELVQLFAPFRTLRHEDSGVLQGSCKEEQMIEYGKSQLLSTQWTSLPAQCVTSNRRTCGWRLNREWWCSARKSRIYSDEQKEHYLD